MTVAVSHQFVGLLSRSIQAQRVVDVVVNRERYRAVRPVHTAAARINQMRRSRLPASFQNIDESNYIAL